MSIFSKLRGAFGGGVRVAIEVPEHFTWEEGFIPVTVHLTGPSSEPARVEELRFHFYDEERGTKSNTGSENGVTYTWASTDAIDLAAGESQTVTIEMPLPYDLDAIEQATAGFGNEGSIGEKLLGNVMRGAMHPPTHLFWFRIRVVARIRGARFGARASQKIRRK